MQNKLVATTSNSSFSAFHMLTALTYKTPGLHAQTLAFLSAILHSIMSFLAHNAPWCTV